MKIVGIRYGNTQAHAVNRAWFKAVGCKEDYPFNIFTSTFWYKFGGLNQILGFLHSLFVKQADVYLLTSTACVSAVWLRKKLFGCKIIAINSDTFYRDLSKAKGVSKWYMQFLVKQVDGMVSTSHLMKALADPFVNVSHEVVYPYVDYNRFKNISPDYDSDGVCSIGTGVATKGTDLLYEAFHTFKKKHKEAHLYVLGRRDLIAHLTPPKGAVLPGIADPEEFLKSSRIYVNSSRHESFGVNILEAMSAGFAPIVTNRCGAAEIVKALDPSLVVAPNAKALGEAMNTMTGSRQKKLSAKARKIAQQHTKEHSCKSFKAAYRRLVA